MWLENLKELKKAKGMTTKQIADATKIPESTLKRIFAGETEDPYVSTIHRIVTVLGGSLDNILADTNAVLAPEKVAEIKETTEAAAEQLGLAIVELEELREKAIEQETEILYLRDQIKLKNEILALISHLANTNPVD